MKRRYSILRAAWVASTAVACVSLPLAARDDAPHQPTALETYVAAPDPSYSFRLHTTLEGQGYRAFVIDLTSQSWLTADEVDRPAWRHWLVIVRPDQVRHTTALLYIDGGRNDGPAPVAASPLLVEPARRTGSITAHLMMVPNQPLTFAGDPFGPRVEDELIAYGWRRYLEGGAQDPRWLARLPMTKAAVRALDTITSFCAGAEVGGLTIDRFVVAGGSKRGWTTWTTAVVDRRVVAIAPFVIDLLNIVPSFTHHYRAYGFWAPAVGDYQREGLMSWYDTPEYARMLEIVEPFSYRARLALPKYIVNATGDQFFLPDSWRFYYHDLPGEKHLRYVANADHGLSGSDAALGFYAFYQAILDHRPRPAITWSTRAEADGALVLRVEVAAGGAPAEARLWSAHNPNARDFRVATIGRTFTGTALSSTADRAWEARLVTPPQGFAAYLAELRFPGGEHHNGAAPAPFILTTGVVVLPDILPYPPPPGRQP